MAKLPGMISALGEKHDQWRVEPIGYIKDPALAAPKIHTALDMISFIKSGELDLICNQYSNYFRVFHNQFLLSYSQNCNTAIADPVTFDVTSIEETIYGDGSRSAPRQAGETYQLTLDRKF